MSKYITVDKTIMSGAPVIKGTRIPIHLVLDHIAAGDSFDDVLKAYPQINKAAIQEAIEYASLAVQEEILPLR